MKTLATLCLLLSLLTAQSGPVRVAVTAVSNAGLESDYSVEVSAIFGHGTNKALVTWSNVPPSEGCTVVAYRVYLGTETRKYTKVAEVSTNWALIPITVLDAIDVVANTNVVLSLTNQAGNRMFRTAQTVSSGTGNVWLQTRTSPIEPWANSKVIRSNAPPAVYQLKLAQRSYLW